ncbi:MAG TPA: amidohydrolase [Myxococcaceae bacterium]|nr:amidohydrolase [Myxococcaceae bacterium]
MKRVASESSDPNEAVLYAADRVRTLNPQQPLAEALLVRWGKVLEVGARRDLESAHPAVRVVELRDATIVPGLADAHGHLASLGRSLSILSFVGASSVEQILEMAKNAPPASYEGEWLVGRGWDQNAWPEGRRDFPTRQQLDALFPSTPVYFTRVDGHAAWVSSEALRRAGVDTRSLDPPGGRIIRDGKGEPSGVLVDNAMQLVSSKMPNPTDEQREKRLRAALEKCTSVGLTAVHDAGTDLPTLMLLHQWDSSGALPLRVYAMADGQGGASQVFSELGLIQGKRFTFRAVKFWLDGALGSRGAALQAPYSDEPTQRGLLLIESTELQKRARDLMQRGYQVAVHAIGDRANTLALDVLSKTAAEAKVENRRNRIEHAQILRAEDIPRFAQLGIIASMQPTHATSDMPWAEQRVGRERIAGAYAWKSLLDAGAHLAFGSDFPVEDSNPLLGLYAARTRQDAKGDPPGGWLPEQKLDGEQALRGFTTGAAYASFAEDVRGMLRPGMDADFVALSVDPVDDPPRQLLTGKALLTVVAGKVAYRDKSLGP